MAFINCFDLKNIIFAPGSRLKSLAYNSFCCLDNLIINNENFVRREDGVVISLNPPGIVFVPKHLTEFDVGSDVEVIYSNAFCESSIESLILPKSLKKIEFGAFNHSKLSSVTFLELNIDYFKFPIVKEGLDIYTISSEIRKIEFPSNFNPSKIDYNFLFKCKRLREVICPASSLQALASIYLNECVKIKVIEDQ